MSGELSSRTTRFAIAMLAATTAVGLGCSSSSTPATGTGGGVGNGGKGGGAVVGSGGRGGATGTGGMLSSSGGTVGSGGVTSTGGADVPGTGGDTGTGGNPACGAAVYTGVSAFGGSIFDGWSVLMYSSPNLVPVEATADAGASGTKAELDPTVGLPTIGSAKLSIPYDGPGETLLFGKLYGTGVNMTGATVTAQIKLDSGLNTSPLNSGQAYLVLKSGPGYAYAAGTPVNLDMSAGWVTLSINVNTPTAMLPVGYTPCDIREIDFEIKTGQTGTYVPAVVHIDTIAVSLPEGATPDGGTADAAAPDGGTADAGTPDAAAGQ